MSTVRSLYGRTAALKFGPRALKRVRDQFLAAGQARIYINQNVARIARIWKWASGEELIPVTAWKHFRGWPERAARQLSTRTVAPAEVWSSERKLESSGAYSWMSLNALKSSFSNWNP